MVKYIPDTVIESFIREVKKDGSSIDVVGTLQLLELLIKKYESGRPCYYKLDCLLYGRCPFDPVCNN